MRSWEHGVSATHHVAQFLSINIKQRQRLLYLSYSISKVPAQPTPQQGLMGLLCAFALQPKGVFEDRVFSSVISFHIIPQALILPVILVQTPKVYLVSYLRMLVLLHNLRMMFVLVLEL